MQENVGERNELAQRFRCVIRVGVLCNERRIRAKNGSQRFGNGQGSRLVPCEVLSTHSPGDISAARSGTSHGSALLLRGRPTPSNGRAATILRDRRQANLVF